MRILKLGFLADGAGGGVVGMETSSAPPPTRATDFEAPNMNFVDNIKMYYSQRRNVSHLTTNFNVDILWGKYVKACLMISHKNLKG